MTDNVTEWWTNDERTKLLCIDYTDGFAEVAPDAMTVLVGAEVTGDNQTVPRSRMRLLLRLAGFTETEGPLSEAEAKPNAEN